MKIVLAGSGAIATQHVNALRHIAGIEIVGLVGHRPAETEAFARKHGVPTWSLELGEALALSGVEAVILTTPTQMHAHQAQQVMQAGKHVLIEIPMADNLADSEAVVKTQAETGVTAMVCHTRRFNPSHQWIHRRIQKGELDIQHFVVETFFFRRENKNALGRPRSWIDHLLWHHACHTVDLFQWQTGGIASEVWAQQGPPHPELGIAMDMTVALRSSTGALCTLALSFNNEGPLGTFFRYICDNGTYIARYDELVDGDQQPIDLSEVAISSNGIELQDREFFAAISEGREPNASVAQALPAMETLDRLQRTLS